MNKLKLHKKRLFPSDPIQRSIANDLFASVEDLPIISPHGHTDPRWFAENEHFINPTELLLAPDHYLFRMLYSQGISLDDLGVASLSGPSKADPRDAWRLFSKHYHLFRGTPSRLWLDHTFATVFDLDVRLCEETADHYFDVISEALSREKFRPRALFDKFNIELLATTEGATDKLAHHNQIVQSEWGGRVISTYRPDAVVDPDHEGFQQELDLFGEITGENTRNWNGYLNAHRKRRQDFIAIGTTSSDHGHLRATTANLSTVEAQELFEKVIRGEISASESDVFRGQMLTEMAGMSLDDGLVMQIHPGAIRNHNSHIFNTYGRDKGADLPSAIDYVDALKPLLDKFGDDNRLSIILFTLDETTYSRELAPLAGHYPALKLGPAWWFHDSPEGMRRFREQTTETAGFYNTVGFNDDTRAFLSIPARHDVARRVDCAFLAKLVAEHRLEEDEAFEIAKGLAYDFAKKAYKV